MFRLVSALRESPRRQPRPNGQVPPACQGPHVSRRPRRRVRPPRMHGRLALLPREAGRTAGGAFSCTGAPQPIPTSEPMQARRASLHISGARPWPTGWPHRVPRAPIAERAARNVSACHGQVCDTADTTGQPARSSSPERPPLADTGKPAPQGDLGMRAQKAGAGSYLSYFAAAWRRAMLALMHSTMPTARTPTIAVTQAAKSLKCRAGIPISRPTT